MLRARAEGLLSLTWAEESGLAFALPGSQRGLRTGLASLPAVTGERQPGSVAGMLCSGPILSHDNPVRLACSSPLLQGKTLRFREVKALA